LLDERYQRGKGRSVGIIVEKKLDVCQKSEGIGGNLIQVGGAQMIIIVPGMIS
jgi:hypothetical protein